MLRVRNLSIAEGKYLSKLARTTRDVTALKRAQIVLHSYQGFSPPKIARMVWWSEAWVRRIIKDWNRLGRGALFPDRAGGREPTFTKPVRRALVDLALSRPRDHGLPVQTWSLDRLRDTAIREGIVETISAERLRQILHEEAVSYQAVKTWKESKDPQFAKKLRRIRELTDREHNPPVVVAADEMGPISLRPYGGRTWSCMGHPARVRATYTRTQGVRHLFAMYDYYHDAMRGFLGKRKDAATWSRFLRYVRKWYPQRHRIYLIQDNLSAHLTQDVRREARRLRITFVPTPTDASHLNPIECHFGELKNLALTNSDYRDWRSLGRALQDAMRYRNTHAVPKLKKVKRCLWVRH